MTKTPKKTAVEPLEAPAAAETPSEAQAPAGDDLLALLRDVLVALTPFTVLSTPAGMPDNALPARNIRAGDIRAARAIRERALDIIGRDGFDD
jgi:hypothetical protein